MYRNVAKRNGLDSVKTRVREVLFILFLKSDWFTPFTLSQFQRYVAKLRSKNTVYKQKRAQLSELRAERGILTRTVDRLKAEEAETKKGLASIEAAQGISGYWETQSNLEKVRQRSDKARHVFLLVAYLRYKHQFHAM